MLAADPDWTKLVKGRSVCIDFWPVDLTEAEIILAAMRGLLCGENGELQNLTPRLSKPNRTTLLISTSSFEEPSWRKRRS